MTLSINLLGSLTVKIAEQTVALPTRKGAMILAYLALNADKPVSRGWLATYLWPESENALGNLRAELVRLRRAIGDLNQKSTLLGIDRQNITLHSDRVEIDIRRLDQLLEPCAAHPHASTAGCEFCCEKLAQAVDLYKAPLLEDVLPLGSVEMADDLQFWQSEYETRILAALETLQVHLSQLGSHAQVIRYARRHLALRPGLEAPTQQLMMAYTLSNNRREALAAYEKLRSYLELEFAEQPSAALTQLYEQIHTYRVVARSTAPQTSPYPGLAAFGLSNAHHFYGRESTIDRLVEAVSQQPLALLTGPSGSGKSSLVYAGLLPRLTQQSTQGGTDWSVLSFRPGRDPLHNLAQAICPEADVEEMAGRLHEALAQRKDSLRSIVVDTLTMSASGAETSQKRVLFVVDQFEEIFTLCPDERMRRFFLSGLFDTLEDEAINLSVLIVLRADFLGQALAYHSFSNLSSEHVHFLGRMNNTQLQRAIEEPARQNGIAYEPGLIERILTDLDDSPGQLPLLQFALALLWEARTDQWITNEAYNDIEQVSGALTHYANGVVARLEPAEQEKVRRIFLQLVHPGENVEDTRRLASRGEIGDESWQLVHRLADARLVVTNRDSSGQETVEVIHEALIQEWGRLREWLDEDRAFHLWQNRARTTLSAWLRQGKDADALLRGLALAEAERWWYERKEDMGDLLAGFIQASLQARTEREEREQLRSRALEAALAESRRMGRRALARQLGAQADQWMQRKADLALLLAAEALQRSDEPQDRTDLLITLDINPFLEKILHGHDSPVFYLSFSADGNSLISSDERNEVSIWRTDSFTHRHLLPGGDNTTDDVALDPTGRWIATVHGRQIALWRTSALSSRILTPDHNADIFRLRFSTDGGYLLSIATDGELCLWETDTGMRLANTPPLVEAVSTQLGPKATFLAISEGLDGEPAVCLRDRRTGALIAPPLLGHREFIHGLALSPDGSRLATASFDGTVRLWNTQTGAASVPPLAAHTGRALFAAFSPDGRLLATGGTDNLLFLWDTESGQRLPLAPFHHSNWVRCAVFSADGATLASGDSDGKIYLWNLARHTRLTGHTKRIRTVAVSPDGKTLATASFDGTICLWETGTYACQLVLRAQANREVMTGRFSPDGTTFAALDNRGSLLLWDTQTWQPRATEANLHNEPSVALAFSPDSRLLAQGDLNGLVSLWNVASGQMICPPTQLHTGLVSWILALAFSPDGKTLATGGKDRTIAFWSIPDLSSAAFTIEAHANWVTHLLYTADGKTLISTSGDGTVRFWNPRTGQECAPPFTGHEGQVWQAEFSPVDGERVLVTLGGNGSVLWWDLESRTPLAPPLRTGTETESMALSPDGKRLYLGAFDEHAHVWRMPEGYWPERSRQIANRSLTAEERKNYLGGPSGAENA